MCSLLVHQTFTSQETPNRIEMAGVVEVRWPYRRETLGWAGRRHEVFLHQVLAALFC